MSEPVPVRTWARLLYAPALVAMLVVGLAAAGALKLIWVGLYVPTLVLLAVPLAAPTAAYAALGMTASSVGLVAALMAPSAALLGFADGALLGLAAAPGLAVGLCARRGARYGVAVAAAGFMLAALASVHYGLHRAEWDEWFRTVCNMTLREMERGPAAQTAALAEGGRALLEWFRDHGDAILPGLVGVLLIWQTPVQAGLASWFARRIVGGSGLAGSFREMRPPEHLVWAAIACAALGFVDYRWGLPAGRETLWNASLLLSAVYSINGMSVMGYALGMVRSRPTALLLAAVLLLTFSYAGGIYPLLCMVGLFDTWFEFRTKLRRLAEAVRARAEEDDGET